MTEEEHDRVYIQGQRAVWLSVLWQALRELHYVSQCDLLTDADKTTIKLAQLIRERESAVAVLRDLCADYGDNDWTNDLFLPDIIRKHIDWEDPCEPSSNDGLTK